MTSDTLVSGTQPAWQLPLRIVVSPFSCYDSLKSKSVRQSITYLLVIGMIASVLSGLLSALAGIDYQNPSNCGGSAQIFAHWFTYVWLGETDWIRATSFFIVTNQLGYLVLALLSGPLLAGLGAVLLRGAPKDLLGPAMAAVCYGMTPGILFGWIPNPFFFFGVLALVYQILALWKMMELTVPMALLLGLLWLVLLGFFQDLAVLVFKLVF